MRKSWLLVGARAGLTVTPLLACAALQVRLLERARFPRYRIGELLVAYPADVKKLVENNAK
jgi:hypothetical protein